jgi:hypothetical protein
MPGKALSIGPLQWLGDAVVVPVVTSRPISGSDLMLFELSASEPFAITERVEFRFYSTGNIDVSSATIWGSNLWVPVRIGEGHPGYHVELWRIAPHQPQLFDTATFLIGQAGADLQAEALSRLVPENPKLVPISDGRAVFGYDHDSLYLVDQQLGQLKLIFHPASAGLRMLDLGSGRIMFWMLHARKAYIINTHGR